VAAARKLLRRSARERAGALLLEGPRHVIDALHAGARVRELFIDEQLGEDPELFSLAAERGVTATRVPPRVISSLSDASTPQGVVAVVDVPATPLGLLPRDASLVVVLAGVRDPGNAGTLVRSAAAAGANAIVFCRGTVDPWHPRTVRASAGAAFRTRVVGDADPPTAAQELRARDCVLLAAHAAGPPADELDLTRPLGLFLGNEAWGMGPAENALVDGLVSVPMPGGVESLNVAIAGSVLMFEAVRQRRVVR
jgi:TrmH family RNA methyltransferase